MKFQWLLPSILSVVGVLGTMLPAEAGTLQTWRFNSRENRLVFSTDADVRPRVQLIFNPTRLVIDLPSTFRGAVNPQQAVGGAIREVRVGQPENGTTRIVVELSPGYTLNPDRIVVRGATPTEWSVQLPTPERVAETPSETPGDDTANVPGNATLTQIEGVQVTGDGVFLRTSGATAEISPERSRDRRRLIFTIDNATISPQLGQLEIPVNRNGVRSLQMTQQPGSTVRLTLNLTSDRRRDWQASASNLGGIVLIPGSRSGNEPAPLPNEPPIAQPTTPAANLATITAVELRNNRQLLIRADRPIQYTSGWERQSGQYRIVIQNAQLPERVSGPQLSSTSSLQQIRLQQGDNQTVIVWVLPSGGFTLNTVSQPTPQSVTLQIQGAAPSPGLPTSSPTTDLPSVPRGRMVITVDPGHGGNDVGAVGIGGIQEAGINLAVARRVAALLEQQGIQAVLTRQGDDEVELAPRVAIAERSRANLFVSIHSNSVGPGRSEVNGVETYYYSDSGVRLAQTVQNSVIQETGMVDRGPRQANFYVIRNTTMPAILVEIGFVTGAEDSRRLTDPVWQDRIATGIVRGVLQYVQQNANTTR